MQLSASFPRLASSFAPRLLAVTALLVDPDCVHGELERRYLHGYGFSVYLAQTPCAVFQMQVHPEPEVAILSDGLGSFQLGAVAEYVRHRWRHAGILVLGDSPGSLEDQLYDDRLGRPYSPEELLRAAELCAQEHC